MHFFSVTTERTNHFFVLCIHVSLSFSRTCSFKKAWGPFAALRPCVNIFACTKLNSRCLDPFINSGKRDCAFFDENLTSPSQLSVRYFLPSGVGVTSIFYLNLHPLFCTEETRGPLWKTAFSWSNSVLTRTSSWPCRTMYPKFPSCCPQGCVVFWMTLWRVVDAFYAPAADLASHKHSKGAFWKVISCTCLTVVQLNRM